MRKGVEKLALKSGIGLRSENQEWFCCEDNPHIRQFDYQLFKHDEDEQRVVLGRVNGYRISHDWTVDDDVELWREADALDGDIVRYVEALIRELRAYEHVFGLGPSVTNAQRITIVRHVETTSKVALERLTQEAVAALAVMDAPVFMLVDPWPMSEERRSPAGKLKGRGNFPLLLKLGFYRMVGSRFLWSWNHEMADCLMNSYSYRKLLAAKQRGELDKLLSAAVSDEVYGPMPSALAQMVDLPEPSDISRE